jgi:hypothetical protein
MQKLVVLNLDGDLDKGVRVTLEIGEEKARPTTEIRGDLPPQPELIAQYKDWQSTYRSLGRSLCIEPIKVTRGVYRRLGTSFRIKPIKVTLGGSRTDRHENCKKLGESLSHQLNSCLDAELFRPIKETLLKHLAPDDTVRVLIKTDNIWLRRLPWQSWNVFDDYPKAEVALSAPEYAQLRQSKRVINRNRIKKKIQILAILGNSDGIEIDKDQEILKELPDAETTFLVEPTRHTLNERIWAKHWDILFFAGHSSSQDDGETGRIYINQTDSLTIYELKYALREAVESGLQLAIFNSCDGLGLARQLEDLQIPQILVMREPVPDQVAQEFLTHFLTQFSSGESLYLAVRKAREKLQGLEDKFPCAHWLPVICQNPVVEPPTWHQLIGIDSHRPKISLIAIVSVVITILAMEIRQLGIFQEWELEAYDQLSQQQSAKGLNPCLPRDIGQSIKFGLTGLLLLGLGFGSWQLASPRIAVAVNNRGFDNYLATRILQAQKNFELAIQVDQENAAAYYNQGWHCEDARDFDCAREKYRRAALLGMAAAYSNLARLSILLDKDYDAAAALSQQGLRLAKDDKVKYALLKNLGWARLGQRRYREANVHLQSAIALGSNRATAHCLLAQVLEAQNDLKEAQAAWETCRQYADVQNPDEDVWMGMAQRRLAAGGIEQ